MIQQAKALLDGAYISTGAIIAQSAVKATDLGYKVWEGLPMPAWAGWVFFVLAIIFGSMLSIHQTTAVDEYITHKWAKPFYSGGFGLFVTLFGIPTIYPHLTIWQLVLPAMALSAIGSQVIYYIIAMSSSPELWKAVKKRVMLIIMGGK